MHRYDAATHKKDIILRQVSMANPSQPFNNQGQPREIDRALQALAGEPPSKEQVAKAVTLLKRGANPNAATARSETPLHLAVQNDNPALADLLLHHKAEPDRENGHGATPLELAACRGSEKTVQALLHHGADPNRTNNMGWSPLMWAASRGHYAVVRRLLINGADAKLKGSSGQTALPLALMNEVTGLTDDHIRIAKLLIEYGADFNAKDRWGNTATDVLIKRGRPEVAEEIALVREKPVMRRMQENMTLQNDITPLPRIKIRKPGQP
ncbi:MAG: hypothetical protein GC185_10100 [Alphaproteobacteria bacterium]|nr:hypothetical protein [Alphaproteobacteria bacterium]